eukprot:711358-Hanusia_phi.AAC.2
MHGCSVQLVLSVLLACFVTSMVANIESTGYNGDECRHATLRTRNRLMVRCLQLRGGKMQVGKTKKPKTPVSTKGLKPASAPRSITSYGKEQAKEVLDSKPENSAYGKKGALLKNRVRSGIEGPRKMRRRGGKRGKAQRRKLRLLKEQGVYNRTTGDPCHSFSFLCQFTLFSETSVIHRVHHQQKMLATAKRTGQKPEVKRLKKKILNDNLMPSYQAACSSSPIATDDMDDRNFMRNQTKTFNSTGWILEEMKFHKLLPSDDSNASAVGKGWICRYSFPCSPHKLLGVVRLLDVGSMTNPYIEMEDAIDAVECLCEEHSFEMTCLQSFAKKWKKEKKKKRFDCIALCLVLNFEGDPNRRGKMLIAATRMLRDRGILLFSLPRSCTSNSRFCSKNRAESPSRTTQDDRPQSTACKVYFQTFALGETKWRRRLVSPCSGVAEEEGEILEVEERGENEDVEQGEQGYSDLHLLICSRKQR